MGDHPVSLMYHPDACNLLPGVVSLYFFVCIHEMKQKRRQLESEIKQLLADHRAENAALKKLIAALQEEEMHKERPGRNSGDSLKPGNKVAGNRASGM